MEIDVTVSALPKEKDHFGDRLIRAIQQRGNPVCVGLDPRLEDLPESILSKNLEKYGNTFEAAAMSFLDFNKGIIDAVAELVPCVKPQAAFYEQYGFSGMYAFQETCKYAQEQGLIVIGDAKRNDIGSTAEAYANAYLGDVTLFEGAVPGMDLDALTVTPYLGYDGIRPFMKVCREKGKGIFVLLKTSNPSSGDLQDQLLDERVSGEFGVEGRMTNYQLMAHYLESWGSDDVGELGYSALGVVVGATYPKQAEELRRLLPQSIFLVPGYGAQGGTADDVKPCFNKDGLGAIVNSSRGILFAYKQERYSSYGAAGYAEAARAATQVMMEDLKRVL